MGKSAEGSIHRVEGRPKGAEGSIESVEGRLRTVEGGIKLRRDKIKFREMHEKPVGTNNVWLVALVNYAKS